MSPRRCLSLVLLLVFASLAVAESRPPAPPDINDEAKLFSKEAKDEVQPILQEIATIGKGARFIIETFPKPEGDVPTDEKDRAEFFDKWAKDRARGLEFTGIYLLVCKEPGHFEVHADKKTKEKTFTDDNRKELRETLAKNFKKDSDQKDYDKGLIAGATLVRDKVKANVGTRESGWLYWGSLILIILIVVWVIIAAIRAVINGGIGEGFMPAFWSALLGAAVGLWLYENVLSKSGEKSEGGKEGDKKEGDKEEGGGFSGEGQDI
jgi:uncharacterized protein